MKNQVYTRFLFSFLLILGLCNSTFAGIVIWDGGGDGIAWEDALNWDTDTEPTATDSVAIPAGNDVVISMAGEKAMLFLIDAGASLTINAGATLDVTEICEVYGVLTNAGVLTSTNSSDDAFYVEGPGSMLVNSGQIDVTNCDDDGLELYDYAVFENSGRFTIMTSDDSGIETDEYTTIDNKLGGIIRIDLADYPIYMDDDFRFFNAGEITLSRFDDEGIYGYEADTAFINYATGVIDIRLAYDDEAIYFDYLEEGFINNGIINIDDVEDGLGFYVDGNIDVVCENNGTISINNVLDDERVYIYEIECDFLNTGDWILTNIIDDVGFYLDYCYESINNEGVISTTNIEDDYAIYIGEVYENMYNSGSVLAENSYYGIYFEDIEDSLVNSGIMHSINSEDYHGIYFGGDILVNTETGKIISDGSYDEGLYFDIEVYNYGEMMVKNSQDQGIDSNYDFFNYGTISIDNTEDNGWAVYDPVWNYASGVISITNGGTDPEPGIEIFDDFTNEGTITVVGDSRGIEVENSESLVNRGNITISGGGVGHGIENFGDVVNQGIIDVATDDPGGFAIYNHVDFTNDDCAIINVTSNNALLNASNFTNLGIITSVFAGANDNTGIFTNDGTLAEAGATFAFAPNPVVGTGTVASTPVPASYPGDLAAACPVPTISLVDADGDGNPDITDPCSCADPLNINDANGNIFWFHDFVEITSGPGETWEISAFNSGGLVDASTAALPLGTLIPEIAPGVYYLDVWHVSAVGYDADFTRTAGGPIFTLNVGNMCDVATCSTASVPTLSEWGIIFMFLLLLTFGTLAIGSKELAFAGRGGMELSSGLNLPFDANVYSKILAGVAAFILVAFMIDFATSGFITLVDICCSMLAAPLFAYLIFLVKIFGKEEN